MTSKTSETENFSFSFGENEENESFCSGFDQAATYLYKILGEHKEEDEERDLMVEIEKYFEKCFL